MVILQCQDALFCGLSFALEGELFFGGSNVVPVGMLAETLCVEGERFLLSFADLSGCLLVFFLDDGVSIHVRFSRS